MGFSVNLRFQKCSLVDESVPVLEMHVKIPAIHWKKSSILTSMKASQQINFNAKPLLQLVGFVCAKSKDSTNKTNVQDRQ